MNFALKLSYKGTNYSGWQIQNNVPTIQGEIQKAVNRVFCEDYTVNGCSRTDAGVHALEYVCALHNVKEFNVEKLPLALNTYLPDDISVIDAAIVSDDFHPRFSALGKEYVYVVYNSKHGNPFSNDVSYRYKRPLNEVLCNEFASEFVGTFDFTSFMAAGSTITDAVRTIYSFEVYRKGNYVFFKVSGNGFLYNMVRIMVGTIINSFEGKINLPIKEIILAKDRKIAGQTMPANGLFLNKVFYETNVFSNRREALFDL